MTRAIKAYKNILVATDLHDQDAFTTPNTAMHLAEQYGAKLVVMTVAPKIPFYFASGLASVSDLEKRLRKEAVEEMKRLKEKLSYEANYIVRYGHPAEEILKEARSCGCDLIVLGSHGGGGVRHILGSTVTQVLNSASCHVLVVRAANVKTKAASKKKTPPKIKKVQSTHAK